MINILIIKNNILIVNLRIILLHAFKICCFINKTVLIDNLFVIKQVLTIDLRITQWSLRFRIIRILSIISTLLSTSEYLLSDVLNHFYLLIYIIWLLILVIIWVHHHYLMLSKTWIHQTKLI